MSKIFKELKRYAWFSPDFTKDPKADGTEYWGLFFPINDYYDKTTVDSRINTAIMGLQWKPAVDSFNNLATTYPSPEDGWTVNVKDTDITYRWSGTAWIAISANAIPMASTTADGKMSIAHYIKLQGIEANANNYTHPTAHPSSIITQTATARFVTDVQINSWTANNSKISFPGFGGNGSSQTASRTDHNHTGIYSESTHTHAFSALTSKPTTIGGYGITDAVSTSGFTMAGVINMNNNNIIGINELAFYSDGNLKIILTRLDDYKFQELTACEYYFKADKSKKTRFGYIAQEVEKIYPEVIGEDSDGKKTINYIELLILEISALKEKVNSLTNRLDKL